MIAIWRLSVTIQPNDDRNYQYSSVAVRAYNGSFVAGARLAQRHGVVARIFAESRWRQHFLWRQITLLRKINA